jgi:hypothetical protein
MSDPAFLMYSKDWLSGTKEMSHVEKGVYIDLLCYQHQNNGLPNVVEKIARIAGMSLIEFIPVWNELKCKFIPGENDRLFNSKLTKEIERRGSFSRTKTIFGIFGAFLKKLNLEKSIIDKIKKDFDIQQFTNIPEANLKAEVEAQLKLMLQLALIATATATGTETITFEGGMGETFTKQSSKPHLFKDSIYFTDKQKWRDDLPKDWSDGQKDYWWIKVEYWSKQKSKNKKIDWIDTARHWDMENPYQSNKSQTQQTKQDLKNLAMDDLANEKNN